MKGLRFRLTMEEGEMDKARGTFERGIADREWNLGMHADSAENAHTQLDRMSHSMKGIIDFQHILP